MVTSNSNGFNKLILYFAVLACLIWATDSNASFKPSSSILMNKSFDVIRSDSIFNLNDEVSKLNSLLQRLLVAGDLYGSRTVADSINFKIAGDKLSDEKIISDSYYLIGVYYLLVKNYSAAIRFFDLSLEIKKRKNEYDERFAKTLYNLGVAYNGLGNFRKLEDYSLGSLEVEKSIFGDSSPLLIGTYASLVTAYVGLQEYEKSLHYASVALSIYDNNEEEVNLSDMELLYGNLGVLYMLLADFSKARLYLEKSESLHNFNQTGASDHLINLMNSMAVTYETLGLPEKADEYYEKGITLSLQMNSSLAYNNINSYAIVLGNRGDEKRGAELLYDALSRADARFGRNSHNYYEVLSYCAAYLREYNIDVGKSLKYYRDCMEHIKNSNRDFFLRDHVYTGYALSLSMAGDSKGAMDVIQSLLSLKYGINSKYDAFSNPDISAIRADKETLRIFRIKYNILRELYNHNADQSTLVDASETAEYIIQLLEKVRINISEDESRLLLGDRYREAYLNAIRDFNLLFGNTGKRVYLEKAFEYLEKSKVAGLLASTRELKAVQFNIPSAIAELEKNLQRDISLYNARIDAEANNNNPDTLLVNAWKDNLLKTTRMRDSLIFVFEKQYPGYYSIKYNTQVINLAEIPEIAGRNVNYINYVTSDTLLYIFIANRKYQQLTAIPVDSSFYTGIREFRSLLSTPLSSENARKDFENFNARGYELYKILIETVRPFLISDRLLISPDNLLSYIPFEALPVSLVSSERILYNKIPYLMNDFDISYTYSATFMAESIKKEFSINNKLIAFAPDYTEPVDIQSALMKKRQAGNLLENLPFALQEAGYVTKVTGGVLYKEGEAKESVFKNEAGKYDIIHLAMHTILNDKDPMESTLIFSPENDTIDDRYLKTYEIYGVPLKAKMVVLSSCNTGSGILYSGEGILSLARGFIYSGSQSVVMSMWEIEDRSGTEIVSMFYDNLKNGNVKSSALRKARIAYLKDSDQLRSHPYFWSSLVVYGNNSSLYYSKIIVITLVVFCLIAVAVIIIYFRKRKYS